MVIVHRYVKRPEGHHHHHQQQQQQRRQRQRTEIELGGLGTFHLAIHKVWLESMVVAGCCLAMAIPS